jgi:hypothetical protein
MKEAVIRIPADLTALLEKEAKALRINRKSLAILSIEKGINRVKQALQQPEVPAEQ